MIEVKYYKIPIESIIPSLILAKPVYTKSATLIANKDTVITWSLINKFKIYDIDYVIVYETPNIDEIADEIVYENGDTTLIKNYMSSTTTNNVTFEQFKNNYIKEIYQIKDFLNLIQSGENGKEIDTKQICTISNNMLERLKYKDDLFTYLNALQVKDDITYRHSLNVSLICNVFGHWLNMSPLDIEMLTTAGLLHDIGKLQIDNELLNKLEPLTELEFQKIKTHVLKSYKMISNHNISDQVKQGILMHHERLDGSGYMMGAKDYEINTIARILAIADMYDALTEDRPYRQKFSPLNVLHYLRSLLSELDIKYISVLTFKIGKSFEGKRARLNTGDECTIVLISKDHINKPLIRIDKKIIDLYENKNLFIRDII